MSKARKITLSVVIVVLWTLILVLANVVFFTRFGNPLPKSLNDKCAYALIDGVAWIGGSAFLVDMIMSNFFSDNKKEGEEE